MQLPFPRTRQVEFHAIQDGPSHPDTARIHHCLLRVGSNADLTEVTQHLALLGDTLTQFTYLETIVVETGHGVESADIQFNLEALRKISGAEVRHRTCDDAHKVALQVKKGTARVLEIGPLSPIWYNDWDMRWKSL